MADSRQTGADDSALIRLALAISAKPMASHDVTPSGVSTTPTSVNPVTVTDTATGETRQVPLHLQDLSAGLYQQLQDRPRLREKQPFEDQFIRSSTPEEAARGYAQDGAERTAASPLAKIADAIYLPQQLGVPSFAEQAQSFREAPFQRLSTGVVPGDMQSEHGLDMAPAARTARRDATGFSPETWYHGTTHDFDTFQRAKANPNSFYGRQFYFTSHPYDAEMNYLSHGPDLRRRIDERADEIENEIVDREYEGHTPEYNTDERKDLIQRARDQANQELRGPHAGVMMPAHLQMQRPIRLTHDGTGTVLDFTPTVDKEGDIIDDSETLKRLFAAVKTVAGEYEDFDAGKVLDHLAGELPFETMKASDFEQALRKAIIDAKQFPTFPDTGGYAGGEVIARIYQEMGFDGIVMEPYREFGQHGTNHETRHAIVFEPHQIRSTNAAFDPKKALSPNILHVDPFGAGAALRLAQSHPKAASTAIGAATGAAIGGDADEAHPLRGALAGAALGAAAGHGIGASVERGVSLLDDRGAVGRDVKTWVAKPRDQFKVTDLPKAARPTAIRNAIVKDGGYTVNPHTGVVGGGGLVMVGKYPNNSAMVLQVPKETFTPKTIENWFTSKKVYQNFFKDNGTEGGKQALHIGGWYDKESDTYFIEIARGEESVRRAVKTGEMQKSPIATRDASGALMPRGQKAVWDSKGQAEVPVGNVHEFINSPQFKSRMDDMQKVGAATTPETSWWDIRHGPIEQTYGSRYIDRVAGLIAATSPQQGVEHNLRIATEYIRRLIAGEPLDQPFFHMPKGSVEFEPGKALPMAGSNSTKKNIQRVARGVPEQLSADKVNDMYHALMGDVNASVYDRHWAKLAEDPASGVFSDREANKLSGSKVSGTRSPYADLENVVRDAAKKVGMSPSQYSAQVWEGIRETIRKTGQLYGQIHEAGAILKTTEGFNEAFERLVQEKAEAKGYTVQEFKKGLAEGRLTLLSALLGTTVGAMAFEQWQAEQQAK